MKTTHLLKWLICCFIVFICFYSCKKEFSYEAGTPLADSIAYATGTLQDSAGNCQDIVINGIYLQDTVLNGSNYIAVNANITKTGRYLMSTDTVNDCWFMDSGVVSNTGLQSFILKGYGKPMTPVLQDFTVHFGQSACTFVIPTQAATYTFNSPSGTCPVFTVHGPYHVGATLNAADTINVPVTVITPGSYSIQTPFMNGMSFSAQGIFTKTGNQVLTLSGTGKPIKKGINEIPLTIAGIPCNFSVNVLLDTSMYWKFTAEGYNYSGVLDSAYGVLGDTGRYIGQAANRVFATQLNGWDNNGNRDSSNLTLVVSRLNTPLTMGVYHPFEFLGSGDWNGTLFFLINDQATTWFYSSSVGLASFTVTVTSFDPASGLIQGTFSGPIYKLQSVNDQSGPIVNITNGVFKTYLAH